MNTCGPTYVLTKVREHKNSSKQELAAKKHEEREKIEPPTCAKLVVNMKNRIKTVIKTKGQVLGMLYFSGSSVCWVISVQNYMYFKNILMFFDVL